MLLHEIFSLFGSLDDYLLTEGFKDDMFKQYPEDVENKDFKAAIASYNSDPKLKEALKHAIKPQGNIAVSIKSKYPTGADFVKLINSLIKNAKDREEYKQLKQGTTSVGETDYWMIPCHTFEELRKAAFMYGGNLPRLSNKEIWNEYGIKAPKSATHYETDKTPEEFLEFMKKENRFFMTPSWCIAGSEKGQEYFNDYELTTEKGEKPLCYIFISKKYPNVRFCITLIKDSKETGNNSYDNDKIIIPIINKFSLDEVRDPWQIGGEDFIKKRFRNDKISFRT